MTERVTRKPRIKDRNPIDSPVGGVTLERVQYEMGDGNTTNAIVLTASPDTQFGLGVDRRFSEIGIKFEKNRLIAQGSTSVAWGGMTVGRRPERYVRGEIPTLAFPPNHYGWMTGQVLVENGEPVLLKNDERTLTESVTLVGLGDRGWGTQTASFTNGQLDNPQDIQDMSVGFSMPLLVQSGEVVPLEETIGDPRYVGDLRNVFDFAGGGSMPPAFWLKIRPLLPENAEDARRLLAGEEVVTFSDRPTPTDIALLDKAINAAGSPVAGKMAVDIEDNSPARLRISGRLPFNRIPLIGSGFDPDGNLRALIIDGRQQGSVGATIPEAVEMMRDEMDTGGFGPAGGDVALVDNQGTVYNSPATRDNKTRPHPVVLFMQ